MAFKKSVGGKVVTVGNNVELITATNCNLPSDTSYIELKCFYIKNEEETKVIEVSINGGAALALNPGEFFDLSNLVNVCSCKCIKGGKIKWGGMA